MKGFLLASLLSAACSVHAQTLPEGDAQRGKAAYMKYMCHTCHGTAGQGGDRGSGPRLAPEPWPYEGFVQQTRRPREVMPRYPREHLPDAELADIYVYLAQIKRGARAADIPLLRAD
jgi:mono/diheme cytochrome c family protein